MVYLCLTPSLTVSKQNNFPAKTSLDKHCNLKKLEIKLEELESVVWPDFRSELSIQKLRLKLKELVKVTVYKRVSQMIKKKPIAEQMAQKFVILVDTEVNSGNF